MAVLVANAHARNGSQAREAHERLRACGLDVELRLVEDPQALRTAVDAAARGADRGEPVFVAGGDGTVTAAVQALVHRDVALGIVPLGTQNNFARSLGLPTDLDAACEVLAAMNTRLVDVGCLDGTYFANAVTIGISGKIAATTPRALKRTMGQAAYGVTGARSLLRARAFRCTLTSPLGTHTLRTHQLVIANGRRVGEAVASPEASAEDALLDVSALGRSSRLSFLAAWLAFTAGKHRHRSDTLHLRVPEIRIETRPRQRLDIDGELAHRTPARIWVEPRALRVVVPA